MNKTEMVRRIAAALRERIAITDLPPDCEDHAALAVKLAVSLNRQGLGFAVLSDSPRRFELFCVGCHDPSCGCHEIRQH